MSENRRGIFWTHTVQRTYVQFTITWYTHNSHPVEHFHFSIKNTLLIPEQENYNNKE